MPFYAKISLRSPGASSKGSATQAMDYLQDDHDSRRETTLDQGELEYIARTGEGWKRDLEGGTIELHGTGRTAGLSQEDMRRQFEHDAVPHYKPARGPEPVAGYKSITLTLPKEVSLYAEGNKQAAIQAMYKAADTALAKAYPGKEISAVSAVHTRNENGEVHFHAHVLVSKFARDVETGKWGSLNWTSANEHTRLKEGWTSGIKQEFQKSLGVSIQERKDGKVSLTLPDGTSLDPLNRNSRRALEKEIAPRIERTRGDGSTYTTTLKLNSMDQKIFEIAARGRGRGGWNAEAFSKTFPKDAPKVERFEKRVETLKQAGYLTQEGRVTQPFKEHAALKWGTETPQLQQLRTELHREARQQAVQSGTSTVPKTLEHSRAERPEVRARMDQLGVSPNQVKRLDDHRLSANQPPSETRRELARVEQQLKALPEARDRALKGAGGVDQVGAIRTKFAGLEAELSQRREALKGRLEGPANPGREHPQPGTGTRTASGATAAIKGGSQAVHRAMPEEAREGSKEVRNSLQVLRGGFRTVAQFMPQEAQQAFAKVQMAARVLGEASKFLQESRTALKVSRRPQEMSTGLRVGLERKDPSAEVLRSWKGRETTLLTRLEAGDKCGRPLLPPKVEAAARDLAQQGARLLSADRPGTALVLPQSMKDHRQALETLNRRFEAYGLKPPFTAEALKGISPANLSQLLAGKGGGAEGLKDLASLAGKGTAWAASSPAAVASVHAAVAKVLAKGLEQAANLVKSLGPS